MEEKEFKFNIPIDVVKGRKDGEWRIGGIASDENSPDLQGERVLVDGLDTSYLLQRGSFNWDHGKDPGDIIGEIDIANKHDNKKLYVEGFLYPDVKKAREVHDLLQSLKSSESKRKLGLSVEGKIRERDESGKVIKKAWIKNVAVTYHPVNQGTWVDFLKSIDGADIQFENSMPIKAEITSEIPEPPIEKSEEKVEMGSSGEVPVEVKSDEVPKEIKQDKKVYEHIGITPEQKESNPAAGQSGPTPSEEQLDGEKIKEVQKSEGVAPGGEGSPSGVGLHAGTDVASTSGGVSGSALRGQDLEKDEKTTTFKIDQKTNGGIVSKSQVVEFLREKFGKSAEKVADIIFARNEKRNQMIELIKSSDKVASAVADYILKAIQIKGYVRTRRGKMERVSPYSKEIQHELHRVATMNDNALINRIDKITKPEKLVHFYAALKEKGKDILAEIAIKRGKHLGLTRGDFEKVKGIVEGYDEVGRVESNKGQKFVDFRKDITFTRKPQTLSDVRSAVFDKKDFELIRELPSFNITSTDVPSQNPVKPHFNLYVLKHKELGDFLVNTEGYDYPRYMVSIEKQ